MEIKNEFEKSSDNNIEIKKDFEEINDNIVINQGKIANSNLRKGNYLYDAMKSTCKIVTNTLKGKVWMGSGFFLKLKKENQPFYCLMTNEHVITEKMINDQVFFEVDFDNQKKQSKIYLKKIERYIQTFTFLNIDVSVIEIIPEKDGISEEFFLTFNSNYI